MVRYDTVQYGTVWYSTYGTYGMYSMYGTYGTYNTARYSMVQYGKVRYGAVQCLHSLPLIAWRYFIVLPHTVVVGVVDSLTGLLCISAEPLLVDI